MTAQHEEETPHHCAECDGTGWRDIKSPDDTPGYAYCSCPIGQRVREEGRRRKQDERAAELAADLPW